LFVARRKTGFRVKKILAVCALKTKQQEGKEEWLRFLIEIVEGGIIMVMHFH
jgi:hypothetical protein